MIKTLRITNFRQFKDFALNFVKPITILYGDNTKGKSTILEALHMITNGISPWGEFEDLFNDSQEEDEKYIRVEIVDDQEREYTYFRDGLKRQIKINGRNTTAKKFFSEISSVIFSPELIEILMISSGKRREFLDILIGKVDIEYSDILSKFNRSLKQRNAYLKKLGKIFFESGHLHQDDSQLIHWTKQVSKFGAEIISKRSVVISKLKSNNFEVVYKPSITFNLFEDLADRESIEKIYYEKVMERAKRDIVTGYTSLGAHRDDWTIFSGKEVKRFGSRGEKRVAIGNLIFQTIEILAQKLGERPLLLLDDIPSELDSHNTEKVLSKDLLLKQQTIITTIDINHIPKKIREISDTIDLNDYHLKARASNA